MDGSACTAAYRVPRSHRAPTPQRAPAVKARYLSTSFGKSTIYKDLSFFILPNDVDKYRALPAVSRARGGGGASRQTPRCRGGRLTIERKTLKAMYYQSLESKALSTRGQADCMGQPAPPCLARAVRVHALAALEERCRERLEPHGRAPQPALIRGQCLTEYA